MQNGNQQIMKTTVLLFDGFETLDVFGPVEILGRLQDHYRISFYSQHGKMISNQHGISIATLPLADLSGGSDIMLIPGGPGVRNEVENTSLIGRVREIATASQYVLTVCTGSALLAATGLLDGRKATSNKRVFDSATSFRRDVQWIRQARWTVDGKFYTSSGVSAGMDMTLGFLRDRHGVDFARTVARHMEYHWQEDSTADEFTKNSEALIN